MKKRSRTSLFDVVHSVPRRRAPSPSARVALPSPLVAGMPDSADNLPVPGSTATASGATYRPPICPAHLSAALEQTFDVASDWVVSEVPQVLPRSDKIEGRSLRFDPEHLASADHRTASEAGRNGGGKSQRRLSDSWEIALGLAEARELLGQEHWVVVVADSRRRATSPTRQQVQALRRMPRLLLVWCDFEELDSAPKTDAADRILAPLMAESQLNLTGPIAGLDLDGVRSILQGLKARQEAALLRVRLAGGVAPIGPLPEPADSLDPVRTAVDLHSAQDLILGPESSDGAPADEGAAIAGKQFSPWLAPWIDEYSRIGQRDIYLWRWCLHGVELTTLPCVPPEWRADAADTKVLAGMLNVLFDDVADQQGNGELLNELLKITHQGQPDFRRFSPADQAYAAFTCRVWEEFWRRASRYPCFEVYRELLHYDLAQLFNTVRYSHLVNCNPYILNLVEHDDYSAQGMGLLSFATVDLMCTPGFPVHELGTLRQAIWHGQWMARIGNLISTWQREVKDRDYTSGVFARAVATRDITVEQLLKGDPAEIENAIERGGHEAHFLGRWRHHYSHLRAMQPHVSAVDLRAVAKGLERLLQTELVSRGRK